MAVAASLALLAASLAVPAASVLATDTVIVSGSGSGASSDPDPLVDYSITGGGSGDAVIRDPDPAYGSIAGARWINTTGSADPGGDGASGLVTTYTVPLSVPVGEWPSMISVEVLADNAVSVFVNGNLIGEQAVGNIPSNFQTVSTYTSAAVSIFQPSMNVATFVVTDLGGPNGVAFKATLTSAADGSPPTLSPVVTPNPVVQGGVASVEPNASDDLSGVASVTCDTPDTTTIGTFSVSCTATDHAGNMATASASYEVIPAPAIEFGGWRPPLTGSAHERRCGPYCPASVFKAGSTIPVKFRLVDSSGNPVAASSPPLWLTPAQGGPVSDPLDPAAFGPPATDGTTYHSGASGTQYRYTWHTRGLDPGFYWRIGVQLDGGQTVFAYVALLERGPGAGPTSSAVSKEVKAKGKGAEKAKAKASGPRKERPDRPGKGSSGKGGGKKK